MSTTKNSNMKTIYPQKSLFFLIPLFCLSFIQVQAQPKATVWATIINPADVPFIDESGSLVSNDPYFSSALRDLDITEVSRAVPSSRKASLSMVYEFSTQSFNSIDFHSKLKGLPFLSGVRFAPDYKTLATPNDHQSENTDYAIHLINAEQAWDVSIGDPSISIAIADQNVDVNHIELAGQIVSYENVGSSSSTHGTAVAVIASGATDNDTLNSHIGYNSSLAIYNMTYDDILAASYAGHKVINLSWSSGCEFNQYEQDIIDEVYLNGSFIVAAAGNGSSCYGAHNLVYPSAYDHVFSVTSTGEFDNHERVDGDPTTTHQHNATVDLCAPGYSIYISPAQGWNIFASGTSYAAPFVSGTVALMLDANPCLANDDIELILKNAAFFIDDINPNYAGMLGAGRLDAGAALEMAINYNAVEVEAVVSNSCSGLSQVELNISGGSGPYEANWSTGDEGLSIENIESGIYSVVVTDGMGCTFDTSIVLSAMPAIEVEANIQHVVCNGFASGAIDITMEEGAHASIFEWDNGSSTEDISNLSAGNYRVHIIDGAGCDHYRSFDILQPRKLDAYIEVEDPLLHTSFADLNLTVIGGMGPYSYSWNTGDICEDLVAINDGFYEVYIKDFNGCLKTVNVTVEIATASLLDGLSNVAVEIYPNPTHDIATIKWEGQNPQMLSILNTKGQLLEHKDISMQNTYQTSRLNPGVYFISLSNGSTNGSSQKLVVR